MAPRALKRLPKWLVASLAAAALAVGLTVAVAGANGEQPPPGAVSDAPVSPQPDVTQPPPGASSDAPLSPAPDVTQPPNPNPDPTGAPTQVDGPEEPGGAPSGGAESGRVDVGGVDGSDRPGGRRDA